MTDFAISGRVVDNRSGLGVGGLRVEAWDKDLIVDDFVGCAESTDGDGRFHIGFDSSYFRGLFGERRPDLFFRVYRGSHLLKETDGLVRRFGPGEDGNKTFQVDIAVDAAADLVPRHRRVRGVVRLAGGETVRGALVRALAFGEGRQKLLGECRTDGQGRYEIRFAADDCPCSGGVVVRAMSPDFSGGPAAQSVFGCDQEATVDLVLPVNPEQVRRYGSFLNGCQVDLPPGNVVERVQYEQIVQIENAFDQVKAAWGTAWPALSGKCWDRLAKSPLALYLPFVQEWELVGHSRGRLIKSFSLAPGEEQTIEVFTWDRVKTTLESITGQESEQSTEATGTQRDSSDVTQEVGRQTGFQFSTNAKVGFKVDGVVDVDLTQGTNATENATSHASSGLHTLTEATTKSTARVRMNRSVKVTESREYGSEERVTRKLRNTNAFHTLNVPFFEVLAHYRVRTYLSADAVRLVALMTSPQAQQVEFNRETVRLHERALRLALLDRNLEPGFAAARHLDAFERSCNVLCNTCTCPDDKGYTSRSWDKVAHCGEAIRSANLVIHGWQAYDLEILGAAAGYVLKGGIRDAIKASAGVPIPDFLLDLIANAATGDITGMLQAHPFTSMDSAKTYIKTYLFRTALRTRLPDVASLLDTMYRQPGAFTEAQADILGRAVVHAPNGGVDALQSDVSTSALVWGQIKNFFQTHMPAFFGVDLLGLFAREVCCGWFADYVRNTTDGFGQYDLAGLAPLLKAFGDYYTKWDADLTADDEARKAAAERSLEDKKERASRILSAFGLQQTAEAQERLDALIQHLRDPANADHYHFAIASERKTLFAQDDDEIGLVAKGILDPYPVGSIGGRFAVPVHLPAGSVLQEALDQVRNALAAQVTEDLAEHILPTAALFSEAIVGRCSAGEPEAVERFRIETRRKELDNDLQALEARRLDARLLAEPPLLDKDPVLPAQVGVWVGAPAAP